MTKTEHETKLKRAVRAAARKARLTENARIRRAVAGYCTSLITQRDDDFGHGWNSALRQVRSGIEVRE